jgi:hypothetical protein
VILRARAPREFSRKPYYPVRMNSAASVIASEAWRSTHPLRARFTFDHGGMATLRLAHEGRRVILPETVLYGIRMNGSPSVVNSVRG